jgi:hypothetical protein
MSENDLRSELTPMNMSVSPPLPTNATAVVQCKKIPVLVIEMEDVCYHAGSGLLLPEDPAGTKEGETDSQEQKRVSGVAALALIFRHFEEVPSRSLLIVGHDDTEGSIKQGFDISKKRAEGIYYLLTGKKSEWCKHAFDCHTIKDYQQIMRYFRYIRGWTCDPGKVDGNWSPQTEKAIKVFFDSMQKIDRSKQIDVNAISSSSDKKWPIDSWEIIYDFYERLMFSTLDGGKPPTPQTMAKARSQLRFLDETNPYIACGDSFPISHFGKKQFRSQANRRVEFLLFSDDIKLTASLRCQKTVTERHTEKDCPLHKLSHIKRDYISPDDINTALYHIKFEYYDKIAEKVCTVPVGLQIKAFKNGKQHNTKIENKNGVYAVRLLNIPAGKRDNDVYFTFETKNAWVYTKDKKSEPRMFRTIYDSDPAVSNTPVTRDDMSKKLLSEQIHYYDLPETWDSREWVASIGDERDDFKNIVVKITTIVEPLVFCLDDIAIADENGKALSDWKWNDLEENRITVFRGNFSKDGPGKAFMSDIGIHNSDPLLPWYSEVPLFGIGRNYIWDHPSFTRLIIAQGNLHEVFNKRVPSGARAAVRLINAPALCECGKEPSDSDSKVKLSDSRSMALQPYYSQNHFNWGRDVKEGLITGLRADLQKLLHLYDTSKIGRCDMALLRFCGKGNDPENAVVLIFLRYHIDFTDTNVPASLKNNKNAQENWIADLFLNLPKRWNGPDGVFKIGITELIQNSPGTSHGSVIKSIKTVLFVQMVPNKNLAHYSIKIINGCRAEMNSYQGIGQLDLTENAPEVARGGIFVAAHETGHAIGLADEYIESARTASYYQPGFYSFTPGAPYSTDTNSMMESNKKVFNRHFWHIAEWARFRFKELSQSSSDNAPELSVKMGTFSYRLPHHKNEPGESFVTFPLNQKIGVTDSSKKALYDIYLYPIGNDETSKSLVPGHQLDGIISIVIRIKLKAHTDNYTEVLGACGRIVGYADYYFNKKNPGQMGKFYAAGASILANGNAIKFSKCLILLSTRMLSLNFTSAIQAGNPDYPNVMNYAKLMDVYTEGSLPKTFDVQKTKEKYLEKAKSMERSYEHITVTTEKTKVTGSQWLKDRTLDISVCTPQWYDECASEISDRIPEILGMKPKHATSVTPIDFVPIVQNVLSNSAQVYAF